MKELEKIWKHMQGFDKSPRVERITKACYAADQWLKFAVAGTKPKNHEVYRKDAVLIASTCTAGWCISECVSSKRYCTKNVMCQS